VSVTVNVSPLRTKKLRSEYALGVVTVMVPALRTALLALPGLGRLRIGCYKNGGKLKNRILDSALPIHDAGFRIQARLHLNDEFKVACREHLLPLAKVNAAIARYPSSTRRAEH